jgi:hypothetical protein
VKPYARKITVRAHLETTLGEKWDSWGPDQARTFLEYCEEAACQSLRRFAHVDNIAELAKLASQPGMSSVRFLMPVLLALMERWSEALECGYAELEVQRGNIDEAQRLEAIAEFGRIVGELKLRRV